jgi:NAD(P)-dependent dehydrogenase (short-subunit alcohol dehydrogenase family)
MTTSKTMLVVGAGDSLGSAIARTFAADGFTVCVSRRNGDKLKPLVDEIERLGGKAIAFGSDARREDQVIAMIDQIEREVGPLEAAVYNVGGNVQFSILETTSRVYSKVWEMGCFGGFLVGREVARRMVGRGRGTILFTGATASLRGSAGYAAFAGAKHGLRALAQSMARELGPKNIHVAHVVIDGPIDTPFTRERFPEIYKQRPPDGVLLPDDIARNYLALHHQKRSAWTHELDLRPWMEPW